MSSNTEITDLEKQLAETRLKLVELKKKEAQLDITTPYHFKTSSGETLSLAQLFADKKDLIMIHNMGKQCAYCTMWADGFNGYLDHFEDRASFVVVSNDSPEEQTAFAKGRQWRFRMVSAKDTTFSSDMGFDMPEENKQWGNFMPGLMTFSKTDDGKVKRVGKDFLGPHDLYNPVWHIYDLLADGVNEWTAKFKY